MSRGSDFRRRIALAIGLAAPLVITLSAQAQTIRQRPARQMAAPPASVAIQPSVLQRAGADQVFQGPDADLDVRRPPQPLRGRPSDAQRAAQSAGFMTFQQADLWNSAYDVAPFDRAGTPYIAAAFQGGLRIYDVSNPIAAPPVAVSTMFVQQGGWRVAVEGNYAFLVPWTANWIHVVDISDVNNPSIVTTIYPSVATVNVNIAVENGVLYAAMNDGGLALFDVSTPTVPTEITVYAPPAGYGSLWDLDVTNGIVFLAYSNGWVEVVDATTPASPVALAANKFAGQSYETIAHFPAGSYGFGTYPYDVVAVAGPDSSGTTWLDIYAWDAGGGTLTNTSFYSWAGTFHFDSADILDDQLFVSSYGDGTHYFNIAGSVDPTPVTPSLDFTHGSWDQSRGLAWEPIGRLLYRADRRGGIDNFYGGAAYQNVDRQDYAWQSQRVQHPLFGDWLFVASGYLGVNALDLADPNHPVNLHQSGNSNGSGYTRALYVDLPYVYAADGNNGLTVWTFDPGTGFTFVNSSGTPGDFARDVKPGFGPDGWRYMYVAAQFDGVLIYDVSNPEGGIPQVGGHSTAGAAYSVEILPDSGRLVVAEGPDGAERFDLNGDMTSPSFETSYSTPTGIYRLGSYWGYGAALVHDGNLELWDPIGGGMEGSWGASPGIYRNVEDLEENLFLAATWGGIRVLNFSNTAAIREETNLELPSTLDVTPGMDAVYAAGPGALVTASLPADLFLTVTPDTAIVATGGTRSFVASAGTSPYAYDVDYHAIDGRTLATIDASTGLLTAVAAGETSVYAYDQNGVWGRTGTIDIRGGSELFDPTWSAETVYNIEDTATWVYFPPDIFGFPIEAAIAKWADEDVPAAPSGLTKVRSYAITADKWETGTPVAPGDFNANAQIVIHYDDADLTPFANEADLVVKRWDAGTSMWVDVTGPTSVDTSGNLVTTYTDHLSFFSVMVPASAASASSLSPDRVYQNTTTVDFSFTAGTGVDHYVVEFSQDSGFSGIDASTTVVGTTGSLNVSTPNVRYYWRVTSEDAGSTPIGRSPTATLFIDTEAPGAPTVTSFGENPSPWRNVDSFDILAGAAPDSSGIFRTFYRLDGPPGGPSDWDGFFTGSDTTGFAINQTTNRTVYFWQEDGAGNSFHGNISNILLRLDTAVPAPPSITEPSGTVTIARPTFSWTTGADTGGSGIAGYTLQIAQVSDFSTIYHEVAGDAAFQTWTADFDFPNSTYWARVIIADGAGNVQYSSAQTFDLSVSTVAAPILTTPENTGWWNTRTVEFSWNPVSGAVEYDIEIHTDAAFNPPLYDSGTVTTAGATYGPLTNGEQLEFFWRVRARDGSGGVSAWSDAWRFTVDFTPPSVWVQALGSISVGAPVPINASADDDYGVSGVALLFRRVGDVDWQTAGMNTTDSVNYSGQIPGSFVELQGFQYLVGANDLAGNYGFATDQGAYTGGPVVGGVSLSFQSLPSPAEIPTNRWLMVSVPHRPSDANVNALLTNLGGYDNRFWRFFQWANGSYREQSNASLQPGRAYWLYHRDGGVTVEVGSGTTLDSGSPYSLTLSPGWNDIGSPWLFSVPWDSVLVASGLDDSDMVGVYRYTTGGWQLPGSNDSVPVWGGVSVYNTTSANQTLRIPAIDVTRTAALQTKTAGLPARARPGSDPVPSGYTTRLRERSGPAGPARSRAPDPHEGAGHRPEADEAPGGWSLRLVLSQEGSATPDAANYVGVRLGAADGWEIGEYPDPPMAPGSTARLAVDQRARVTDAGLYATDYRAPGQDGYTWELVAESDRGEERATVMVDGIARLPTGVLAALVDQDAGLRIDLSGRDTYRFYPGVGAAGTVPSGQSATHRLRLVVGSTAYVNAQTVGMTGLPPQVRLHANYPNPFNPTTTIRFDLAEASRVDLQVFNVRGQVVRTLVSGSLNGGPHTVTWDGKNDSGREVSSGIYLYRIQADGVVISRKMTLVR